MKRIPMLAVPAVLAVVLLLVLFLGRSRPAAALSDTRQTLAAMEAGDPDAVVGVIRQQQKARMEAEKEELREKLISGETDPWSLLQDYVILGDSRPAGFYYYGFCPRERVLADAGHTIRIIPEQLEQIVALHPARAYLSFGINDINIGFWDNPDEYTAEFKEKLDLLREALPDMEIYVNSILPVQDWALYKGEAWPRVPEYNIALREMCREWGCTYIDNDAIIAEHQNLYDSDGIHFAGEFYTYWVTNFILASLYPDAEDGGAVN